MKIGVGSGNPVKIKATENVFKKIYSQVKVEGVNVKSEVSEQPIGLNETIKGAINRSKNAFQDRYDLTVGIESGLLPTPQTITGYVDLQWCSIYDGEKTTLGVSAGFEYPPLVIKEVLKGKEVGEVMDQLTGVEKLGQKVGAVSYLSHGLLDRMENTEQCVLMAMMPRMNKKLYF